MSMFEKILKIVEDHTILLMPRCIRKHLEIGNVIKI